MIADRHLSFERHQYMDVRKLWDNADENSEAKNVCDVYGAEHLARLIGAYQLTPFKESANLCSLVARALSPDEHGSAICVSPPGGDWQIHCLARQELRDVFRQRIRDAFTGVH